jgi:hypothetical protein
MLWSNAQMPNGREATYGSDTAWGQRLATLAALDARMVRKHFD